MYLFVYVNFNYIFVSTIIVYTNKFSLLLIITVFAQDIAYSLNIEKDY